MTDEYIRREDVLNAVEKLDIIPSVDGMGIPTDTEDFRVQFLGTVLKVEPVDVAPVVRCGQCIYWQDNDNDYDYGFCYAKDGHGFGHAWDKNDFCSYGERKEQT